MSDTPPPPYSDRDLYEKPPESTSHDLNSGELAKAQSALAKAAYNPNNGERTVEEINVLVKEGVVLANRLQGIHNLVIKAGLSSEYKVKQLRDRYIDLLWRSREIAGKALGAVKEFNGDLLKSLTDPDETPQSKMADLTETWNVIKSKGAEAQKQLHEFDGLFTEFSEYSKTVQEEIAAEDTKEKAQTQAINMELEKYIEEPQNSVIDPQANRFKSFLSGSLTIAFNIDTAVIVNGISDSVRKYKENHLKKKSEERIEPQNKPEAKRDMNLENQQAIIGNISIVPDLVASIRDDIATFAKKLTTFIDVFDQLQDEYNAFVLLLKPETPVTDPAFRSRVQLIKSLSPRIVSALELYSKAQIRSV